jgi:hypothetical protein
MSISIEAHDRICQDLHQQIRSLIVENEKLRAALEQPEQEPEPKSTWQKLYEAAIDQRNEAVAEVKRLLEQPEQTNPWRDAVDDELVSLHMVASDDPRESIRRLIDWHCAVQIDPLVSSAAQELIERGRREALEQPEQERKLTDEVIADLWHQNGGFHHHFARALERWLKGQA